MSKVYVEVNGGMVTGVYTDSKEDIDIILCDHDNAEQETEGDCFEFSATNNCKELDDNRSKLENIY